MDTIHLFITKRVWVWPDDAPVGRHEEQTVYDDKVPIARVPCVGEEIELAGNQYTVKRVIWAYDYEGGPLRRHAPLVTAR